MPELPEVETVRKVLINQILNKKIIEVDVRYPKIIANTTPEQFKNYLIGQSFIDIKRKGKYLIFILSNGYLISHLRMEGKYKFDFDKEDKHSHIIFYFENNDFLVYNDVRKFGKMFYFDKNIDIYNQYPLNKLGMEPFELNDGSYLYDKSIKSKLCLKQLLLDQSILCGIGNIYADEICFLSKLSPLKKANRLTLNQCKNIIDNAKLVLNKAINLGGSTIKTYQSAHGVDGKFQNELLVYGKENQKCPTCNNLIIKIKLHGRGTCYCPNCQKE